MEGMRPGDNVYYENVATKTILFECSVRFASVSHDVSSIALTAEADAFFVRPVPPVPSHAVVVTGRFSCFQMG
jgi:hypothetical protein